jgi:hypothetical protein
MKTNWIPLIVLLITVIGGTVGTVTFFAKADDLQLVEQRLDQKIKADKVYFLQQRLWQLYDRYKTEDCAQMPQPSSNECRGIKAKMEMLKGKG